MTARSGMQAVALAILVVAAAAASACERPVAQLVEPPATAPEAMTNCLEPTSPDYYFAPGQISAARDDAFIRREWFRNYLRAAGEESLSCGGPTEAYRLMWLTPSRNSKIFTLRRVEGFWRLQMTNFGDQLSYLFSAREPHKVTRSTRAINEAEARRIAQELELSNFWSTDQYRLNPNVDDGYALVIEGRSGNKYRVVTRVNTWDGAEQIACPFFDLARVMSPDPIRCARPVTVD